MSERTTRLRRLALNAFDVLLIAVPFLRRARLWARLLRAARPYSDADGWRLLVSGVLDIAWYPLTLRGRPVPQTWRTLTLRLRDSGVLFTVRGQTDDIYHALPGREADVHDLILDLLNPGDTFVDVGANIGYYTVRGSKQIGPNGVVVALEPVPQTAAVLRENVRLNELENVRIIEAAATDGRSESVSMSVPGSLYGRAAVTVGSGMLPVGNGEAIARVRAVALREACRDLGTVRLMKLDVEGNELRALEGAGELLDRTTYIVLECNTAEERTERLLRDHGFQIARLGFTTHRLAYRGEVPTSLRSGHGGEPS